MFYLSKKNVLLRIYHLFIIVSSLFVTSTCFANTPLNELAINMLSRARMVVSIGGGVAISSDIGDSKTFPIVNPISDEFYIYTATHQNQTVGTIDSFIGAEWGIYPNWALQLGLGYNQAWNFRPTGTLLQGADLQSADQYAYHYNILSRQILAEGKLLYQFNDCYHPYVLLGLGVAFNKASQFNTNVPPFLTFTRQYQDNTQKSFTYSLGLGLDVDVREHLRFGISYRFVDLGRVQLGKAIIDTTPVSGTLSQSNLYTHEVIGQISLVI